MIVAAVTLNELKGVVPPTAPVNVVVPDPPAIVNACAPFNVLPKVMFALFEVIVLVPVRVTGIAPKVSGFAPETVILAPTWIATALVKLKFVKGVTPPTAPEKIAFPAVPARIVTAVDPFKVFVKLTLAPAAVPPKFVLSKIGAPDATTGPVIVMMPPAVLTNPPILMAEVPV